MVFEWILGVIVFILDIWAVIKIVQSGASAIAKIIWVVVIFFLPVVGVVAWLIFGPK
jgi:hypothetical protein